MNETSQHEKPFYKNVTISCVIWWFISRTIIKTYYHLPIFHILNINSIIYKKGVFVGPNIRKMI